MKKPYVLLIGLGIVAILIFVFMMKAKSTAQAINSPSSQDNDPNRSILQKVNDISYDILFKWWYDPIFKTY